VLARLGDERGPVVGWTAPVGAGRVTCFGANVAAVCAGSRYYVEQAEQLGRARDLLRWIADLAGARPAVRCVDASASVWARRSPAGGGFLFVTGRLSAPQRVRLELLDPAAVLGEGPGPWRVTELLEERVLLQGAAQVSQLEVPLGSYGTALLRISQE